VRYEITHRTTYTYSSDVSVSHHVARLTPPTHPTQNCLEHEVTIEPNPSIVTHHQDYFGNRTTFFTVAKLHRTLVVTARSRVEISPGPPAPPANSPAWEKARAVGNGYESPITPEIQEFAFPSVLIRRLPQLGDYARESFIPDRPLLEATLDLTRRINQDFKFDPKATTVATPLEQVIRDRRGVCQDFAHFQIGCLRALGLAARYVSGYLETLPPPGTAKLVGADASHAWVQVFIPSFGWIDVDPTNNLLPSDRHITVARGRDFDDVSVIRGVMVGGGKHQLNVAVDVTPLP
jgi:transglutaminase-like putative cysteine protease